jgi:hypothetical protein
VNLEQNLCVNLNSRTDLFFLNSIPKRAEGRICEVGQTFNFWVFKLGVSIDLKRIKSGEALFFQNVKSNNMVTVRNFSLVLVLWRLKLATLAVCFI